MGLTANRPQHSWPQAPAPAGPRASDVSQDFRDAVEAAMAAAGALGGPPDQGAQEAAPGVWHETQVVETLPMARY